MPQKRYCYVDESGQDTHGDLFIVAAVVIAAEDRDALLHLCQSIERAAGKRSAKWRTTIPARRLAYIQQILTAPQFAPVGARSKLNTAPWPSPRGPWAFRIALYRNTLDYLDCTAQAIASALTPGDRDQETIVLIDALPPSQSRTISHILRRAGIHTQKVRGIRRDENDALIRLADALCGFVRDAIEGDPGVQELYARAIQNGVIKILS